MKLQLVILATLLSLVQSSRYGLLRVGSASVEEQNGKAVEPNHNARTIFDEDFSLAFRQLFGSEAGLSMAGGALNLSLSMPAAQLSLSMMAAQLNMSMGPPGTTDDVAEDDELTGGDDGDDFTLPEDPLAAIGDLLGPEAIKVIAALGGIAVVIGLLAVILASLGIICPTL